MGEKVKKYCILFTVIIMATVTVISCTPPAGNPSPVAEEEPVTINDQGLDAAIRAALAGAKMTPTNLAKITILDASNREISALDGIEYLTKLDSLDLSNNNLSDIGPLVARESNPATISKLKTLSLSGNTGFASESTSIALYENVRKLTSLTSLDISHIGLLNILPVLGPKSVDDPYGLTALTNLNIGYNKFNNIITLQYLTQLTVLNMDSNADANALLAVLGFLTNLNELSLRAMPVARMKELSFITNLTKLNKLSISQTNIPAISNDPADAGNTDGSYFNCASLKEIVLSGCSELTDIKLSGISTINLTGCDKLKTLVLKNGLISDLSTLAGLTSLGRLDLSQNMISDISVLSTLTELNFLKVDHNQIANINALASLTKMTFIDLSYCNISDITPLINNPNIKAGVTILLNTNPIPASQITDLESTGALVVHS